MWLCHVIFGVGERWLEGSEILESCSSYVCGFCLLYLVFSVLVMMFDISPFYKIRFHCILFYLSRLVSFRIFVSFRIVFDWLR